MIRPPGSAASVSVSVSVSVSIYVYVPVSAYVYAYLKCIDGWNSENFAANSVKTNFLHNR
jgi:hypothetical protein